MKKKAKEKKAARCPICGKRLSAKKQKELDAQLGFREALESGDLLSDFAKRMREKDESTNN